jgi:hypothetical protein
MRSGLRAVDGLLCARKAIGGRIRTASRKRRSGRPAAQKEPREELDGISEIDRTRVVGIRSLQAGYGTSGKKVEKHGNGVADVNGPIAVHIAADEVRTTIDEEEKCGSDGPFRAVRGSVDHALISDPQCAAAAAVKAHGLGGALGKEQCSHLLRTDADTPGRLPSIDDRQHEGGPRGIERDRRPGIRGGIEDRVRGKAFAIDRIRY